MVTVFSASADVIGKGVVRLLEQAKRFSPDSKILLISPIFLGERVWEEGFDQEFSPESVEISKRLGSVYEKIAKVSRLKKKSRYDLDERDVWDGAIVYINGEIYEKKQFRTSCRIIRFNSEF